MDKLKHSKSNKGIGLNDISACLLKEADVVIAPILTRIFNQSLVLGNLEKLVHYSSLETNAMQIIMDQSQYCQWLARF